MNTEATGTVFRRGDSGPAVAEIRALLERIGLLEGDPGAGSAYDERVELAVRNFQQQRGLTVDGDRRRLHLPPAGRGALDPRRPGAQPPARQPDGRRRRVRAAARLLDLGFKVGRVDGYFGPETEAGLRDFQRNVGLPPDGTCGPATLKALGRLQPRVSGGAPNAMRAQERIRRAGPQLAGKIVVIDPGRCCRSFPSSCATTPRRTPGRSRSCTTSHAGSRAGWWRPACRRSSPARPASRTTRCAGHEFANRTERRPDHLADRRRLGQPRRLRGVDVLLRLRDPRHPLVDRREVRRPGAARDRRPHRPARPAAARQDLGVPPQDPDARRPAGPRLPHQRRRRRPAGRPRVPRHASPRRSWSRSSASTSPPRSTRTPACSATASCAPRSSRGPAEPQSSVRCAGVCAVGGRTAGERRRTGDSNRSNAASSSLAPGEHGAQVHPHPRVARVRPVGAEADPEQVVGRQHAARRLGAVAVRDTGRPPGTSPNASTARMPPRLTRSLAIACISTRPSPPPRCAGSTRAATSRTASGVTGAVGEAGWPRARRPPGA